MPRRARAIVDRLGSSKHITRLLKVLNQIESYDAPGWEAFRRERIEDLEWLWNPRGNPPAAKNIHEEIMGRKVPLPRFMGLFLNAGDFENDDAAMSAAFACLLAVRELAEFRRANLISRCVCGTFLFHRKVCNGACKAKAHRLKSRSKSRHA